MGEAGAESAPITTVTEIATERFERSRTLTNLYSEGSHLLTRLDPDIAVHTHPNRFVRKASEWFGTGPLQDLEFEGDIKGEGEETHIHWQATARQSDIQNEPDSPDFSNITFYDVPIPETGERLTIDFKKSHGLLALSATEGAKADKNEIVKALWSHFKKVRTSLDKYGRPKENEQEIYA